MTNKIKPLKNLLEDVVHGDLVLFYPKRKSKTNYVGFYSGNKGAIAYFCSDSQLHTDSFGIEIKKGYGYTIDTNHNNTERLTIEGYEILKRPDDKFDNSNRDEELDSEIGVVRGPLKL